MFLSMRAGWGLSLDAGGCARGWAYGIGPSAGGQHPGCKDGGRTPGAGPGRALRTRRCREAPAVRIPHSTWVSSRPHGVPQATRIPLRLHSYSSSHMGISQVTRVALRPHRYPIDQWAPSGHKDVARRSTGHLGPAPASFYHADTLPWRHSACTVAMQKTPATVTYLCVCAFM